MEDNTSHLHMEQHGIMCDNPACDYEDRTVKMEDLHEWVNRECPKCGAVLFTEEDYSAVQELEAIVAAIDTMSSEEMEAFAEVVGVTIVKTDSPEGMELMARMQLKVQAGKLTIGDIPPMNPRDN